MGIKRFTVYCFLHLPKVQKILLKVNPILHTAWLNSHALTLKSNTAKYSFAEKSNFFLPKILLWIKENLSQPQKLFNFNAISVLKK
jgi:hypothetical protein